MENFIDDNTAYMRLRPPCTCRCFAHCGISCMTDDCDCTECQCDSCKEKDLVFIQVGITKK